MSLTQEDKHHTRGKFDSFLDQCRQKELFRTGILQLHKGVSKKPGITELQTEKKHDIEKNEEHYSEGNYIFYDRDFNTGALNKERALEGDTFEYTEGISMVDIDYLNNLKNGGDEEKLAELKELIEVFHELQIPDTDIARNKEKKMKEYLQAISFAIVMFGMIPPIFSVKMPTIILLMFYQQ